MHPCLTPLPIFTFVVSLWFSPALPSFTLTLEILIYENIKLRLQNVHGHVYV